MGFPLEGLEETELLGHQKSHFLNVLYKHWVACVSVRMHQASLGAARQRLEGYQRALQARISIHANEPPHRPPLLSTWSSQLAAALSHLPNSAMPPSLQEAQSHTRESLPVSAPRSPDFRAPVESVLRDARPPATDVSPSLAEVLLERIKGRLQHRARPGQAAALPPDLVHPLSLGPTKDHIGGRREEQVVVVQHRRQQKQHLPSDAQVDDPLESSRGIVGPLCLSQPEPIPAATPEEQPSGNVGQIRRRLLQSLIKAIEQRNGGTLSHLEDVQPGG